MPEVRPFLPDWICSFGAGGAGWTCLFNAEVAEISDVAEGTGLALASVAAVAATRTFAPITG